MKVRLIGHASVITTCRDTAVLCDPWLFGRAFNESWSLHPEPVLRAEWLAPVDFLWISHEHPDHLHFPSLRSLPESFRARVTVLYQDRAAGDVRRALRRIGFRKFRRLRHRTTVHLTPKTRAYGYLAPYGDSCLGLLDESATSLNLNDAQLGLEECRLITDDVGPVDTVLKQFSLAGYTGAKNYAEELPSLAESILAHFADVARALKADTAIPFASFMYFSRSDNAYMNEYGNSPERAYAFLREAGVSTALLFPGDELDSETPHDSSPALARYARLARNRASLPIEEAESIPEAELREGFRSFAAALGRAYPRARVDPLPSFRVRVPDLDATFELSIPAQSFERAGDQRASVALEAGSHALAFCFATPFGFETLGVSARGFVLEEDGAWAQNRELLWLYRRGIHLAPKRLLDPRNLARVLPWARTQGWTLGGARRRIAAAAGRRPPPG